MGGGGDSSGSEPNLTPILDMVFQLITFFMLVINFQGASLDLSLKLPVLGSARPLDAQTGKGLLVLNVDAQGKLNIYGVERDIKEYIQEEARVEVARLSTTAKPVKLGEELPTMVVIRADRNVPFRLLNNVITECQKVGYHNYALRAMNRAGD
jgi:biopolymer transport protein ExbD